MECVFRYLMIFKKASCITNNRRIRQFTVSNISYWLWNTLDRQFFHSHFFQLFFYRPIRDIVSWFFIQPVCYIQNDKLIFIPFLKNTLPVSKFTIVQCKSFELPISNMKSLKWMKNIFYLGSISSNILDRRSANAAWN